MFLLQPSTETQGNPPPSKSKSQKKRPSTSAGGAVAKKQKPTAAASPQHEDLSTAEVVKPAVEPTGPSEASTTRKPTLDADAAASKGKSPVDPEPSAQVTMLLSSRLLWVPFNVLQFHVVTLDFNAILAGR